MGIDFSKLSNNNPKPKDTTEKKKVQRETLFQSLVGSKEKVSRFDRHEKELRKDRKVFVRERVLTPFPTPYLPTIPLKISAILRYYQFRSEAKRVERQQRRERDKEISMYSVLTQYLENEIELKRSSYIDSKGSTEGIMLFKVDAKFNPVLGRVIEYLSIQDSIELVTMNSNIKVMSNMQGRKAPPNLLLVELKEHSVNRQQKQLNIV